MTNINNPDDMNEAEVNELSSMLRNQLSDLNFEKETKFVKSKSPWTIGVAAAAVSALAISFSLSSGGSSKTWAAEPNTNAGTKSSSEASCSDANAVGSAITLTASAVTDGTPIPSTASAGGEAGAATVVTSSAVALNADGSAITADGGDGVIVSGTSTITLSQAPELQAFDSRGKFSVSVMSANTTDKASATIICVTSSSDSGATLSGVSVLPIPSQGSTPTDSFNVTTNADGTKSTIGFGPLVKGATEVILSVKGLPDAHATIYGDSYAIWWPYDGTSTATIKELDKDGKILKTIEVPVSKINDGGLLTFSSTATLSSASTIANQSGVVSSGAIEVAPSESSSK